MCKKHKLRRGAALEHGDAHTLDHQLWTRRDFLSTTGLLGAGSLLLGHLPIRAFQPSPLMAALAGGDSERILVLIRLDGGNDALNTVVERGNSYYYNLRPTLAIPDNQLWALSPQYGMPAFTDALQPLWNEGMMKVIFNVGYEPPNYSHFRSTDIITSASDPDVKENTGWLGRFLDNQYAAFLEAPPTVPPALQIGVQSNLVFQADTANLALSVSSPQQFYQIAQTGQLFPTAGLGNSPRDLELAFVRQTANAAFRYAQVIRQAYYAGKNEATYPSNNFAEQMAIVARLIKGRLGTRIFMVELTGFDTHVAQENMHRTLLTQVATAVRAFYDDLSYDGSGLHKKVLGMTFSEFGRSIYENGSRGTDHGAGTHTLLFGGDIGNGFVGQYQDLSNPDPVGDPPHSVDFRSVYATILQNWLGNTPGVSNFVLGKSFPVIPNLVPALTPPAGDNNKAALLGHNPSAAVPGAFDIKYSIMQSGPVRLQILDKAGHVRRTLIDAYHEKGSHTFTFKPAEWYLTPGAYQYRLLAGGQAFQREIKI